jgi:SAM-dependent methyltransferase
MSIEIPRHQRIVSVLDGLGLDKAHFAGQVPSDFAGLIAGAADRIASLSLVCPEHTSPEIFGPVAERLLAAAGDGSMADQRVRTAMSQLSPPARLVELDDYKCLTWSDVLADHGNTISAAITDWAIAKNTVRNAPEFESTDTDINGIRCTISGSGPPLLLAPMALAPSQWAPVLAELGRNFTTIQMRGPHLGVIPLLEARGSSAGYRRLLATMLHLLGVEKASQVLDVGCGTGVVERWLAGQGNFDAHVTAVDINDYLLGEARWLAEKAGVTNVDFRAGDAQALPFDDDVFDTTFSATVMEEVNAEKMLAELVRVTKPGGRIGIIVRALDLPRWTSMDLPPALKSHVETWPDPSEGEGCASARLYDLMARAGLVDRSSIPDMTAFCEPDGPVEQLLTMMLTADLDETDKRVWQAAHDAAVARDCMVFTWPHHCAVGRKPADA